MNGAREREREREGDKGGGSSPVCGGRKGRRMEGVRESEGFNWRGREMV